MNDVLNRLIMEHKGPWKDFSEDSWRRCKDVCEAVAGQIIASATGFHPEAWDGLGAEYDFNGKDIWIYLTFDGRATHTAEQIARAFQEIAGVAVNVKVWECASEHTSE